MALHSGFFVSIAGDKRYNTAQMSEIFDGIINDGVFQSIGTCLMAEAASGMTVNIGIGRAWFNHTWTLNDAPLPLTLDASELVLDRIDTVVLRVDHREAVRDNFIEIIKGTPATEPVPANLVDTDETFYHPLAYIYVASGVTEITQSNITNNVGSTDVPFVTGILETVSTEALITQWAAEWVEWLSRIQNEGAQFMSDNAEAFNEWFENLQYVLDGDVAGHLQNEINDLQDDTAELADTVYALITREGQMTSPSESKTVLTSIYPGNPNYRAKVALSANGNFERWITTDGGTNWDLAEGDLAGATMRAGLSTFVLNSPYYKASGALYEFIVSDATVDVASEYGMKAQIADGSATLTFDNPLPSDVVIENVHIRKYNV